MITRYRITLALVAILSCFILSSCTDDLMYDNASTSSQFDESDIIDAKLSVSVNNFRVSTEGSTREEEPTEDEQETMSDFEKQVENICVFQYNNESGELLIKPRYYTAKESESDGIWNVLLKPDVKSTIYVVANITNGENWASDYNNFMTIDNLLEQTLPSPYPIILDTEESNLPMQGGKEGVVVSDEEISVDVTCMYAKIKVKVLLDREILLLNQAEISNVTLSNIPWYCRIGTLYDEENMDVPGAYPSGIYWITRAIGEENYEDEDGFDYVFYIPENIQGEIKDNEEKSKTEAAPDNALLITAQISYKDEETGESLSQNYMISPGGNNYNNYNVRRNCVYRVALNIGYPIEQENHPSANCIVASPYTTVSFEPYNRVEEGGGYSFKDYLDPNDETKQIKAVKILWQTEGCIGDNTDGNLVYFAPLRNNTEQNLHSKIYVTVKEAGNAVIAAYDANPDENPSANIIWSWHIWVPNAEVNDPTNEANGKLFTTYYWDSENIYGYKDADGNVTSNNRTPGYTIMDLNLGALSSEPTTTTFPETYGLLYQFGRKDPFPCARYNMRGEGYADSITGPIYDDAYNLVKLTSADVNDLGDDDYLFYSISGNTSSADPTNYGIAYSIKHPTVFLCGTEDVNSTSEITTPSRYVFDGNWTQEEGTDNLWGAIPVEETTKTYYVGKDNNGHDRHLYDDYGEEKSIFDPCPYGWRISPPDLWLSFTDTGLNPQASLDEVNGTYRSGCYGFDLYLQAWRSGQSSFFPMQGPRTPDGCIRNSRICGNYMNATADTDNRVNILHVHNNYVSFCIFEMINPQYYFKSTGGSVRCVRETR